MSDRDLQTAAWPAEVQPVLAAAAAGPITVDLTTKGRKSQQPRRIEIWIVAVDGRIIITGTPSPRDWLANIHADPFCTVHLKDDPSAPGVVADVRCVATPIVNDTERRAVLEHASTVWYRNQGPLPDLIARAPMVVLTPR